MSAEAEQKRGAGAASASAYGWVIVALTFLSMGLVLGSRFSLGMFLPYLPDALNSSAADVSGALAISMLGAAVVQPFSGILLDRWGGGIVLSLGLACGGLALVGTAFSSALWQMILFMGLGSSIAYAAVSPVSTTSIVASWFDRHRGTALGVATSGTKVATVVLPPLLAALLFFFGWRVAMASLGVLIWLLIPAVLLWVKPAPGSPAALKAERRRSGVQDVPTESPAMPGMTLQEALRVPTFWLIAISLFANGLIMNLVFIHLPNYMLSQGYSEALAATGLSILAGVGILGTIVTGTLSDRLGRRNVLLLMFGARGFTALLVILIPGPLAMLAFVAVFGILGYGAIGVFGSLATELFGKRAIGSILGSAYVFNQVGGAAGVYIGGASFEMTNSYSTSLWVSIIVTLLSIVCVALTAPEPRRAASA